MSDLCGLHAAYLADPNPPNRDRLFAAIRQYLVHVAACHRYEEDVVQDCLLWLCANLATYDATRSSLKTFLSRSLRWAYLASRRSNNEVPLDALPELPANEPEERIAILACENLSGLQQLIIRGVLEGLSLREISRRYALTRYRVSAELRRIYVDIENSIARK